MDEPSTRNELSWRDIAVIAPALGSFYALGYEVGYFLSIGLSLFSLFNLSEHIVFALEALPIGVFGALPIILTPWYFRQFDKLRPLVVGKTSSQIRRWRWYIFAALCGILLLLLAAFALLLSLTKLYGIFVGLLFLVSSIFMVTRVEIWSREKEILWGAVLSCAGLILAVGLGVDLGHAALSNSENPYSVNAGEFTGKLLIGGDRGVLFFDKNSNKVIFIRWDRIETIERSQPTVK